MDAPISDREDRLRRLTVGCAAASATLFTLLFAITVATGTSQQWFEVARPPAVYANALVASDAVLRVLITIDDAFIGCYVATTLLFATLLARGRLDPLCIAIGVGGVAAGVLDLAENHHILALLALARNGIEPPLAELTARMTYSGLKWMLAHVAFFGVGLALMPRNGVERFFRFALLAVQLPIGALAWTVTDPAGAQAVAWLRAVNLLVGFALTAWIVARPQPSLRPRAAAGSGAPA